jgi:hypothetical protein
MEPAYFVPYLTSEFVDNQARVRPKSIQGDVSCC